MTIEIEMGKAAHLQRQGKFGDAALLYQRVLKTDPKMSVAYYNLALIYKAQKKSSAAEKAFKSAVKYNPKYVLAWNGYVRALSDRGKKKEALRLSLQAAKNQKYTAESCQFIADQLHASGSENLGNIGREALLICLNRKDIDFDGTIHAALTVVREHNVLKHIFTNPNIDNTANSFITENPLKIIHALLDPLPAKIISNLILPTYQAENGLILLREALKSAPDNINPKLKLEACSLISLQMELREYSIYSTEFESPNTQNLLQTIEFSMFHPLPPETATDLSNRYADELRDLPWTALLLDRLGLQIQNRETLKQDIPSLMAIEDKTSLRMQNQYEENPYPRWFGLRQGGDEDLPTLVSRLFSHINTQNLNQTPQILVAGCGTGRHALRTAARIKNSSVVAIDLSKSSLAYGFSKSKELGFQNIHFVQADIGQLPKDIGQFDLIECCGVLHHMAKPVKAWSHLRSFLKPNGLMKIALYSELARQDVLSAQAYLELDPLTLTAQDIKKARRQILDLPSDHRAKSVSHELDFYSVSGCRDFLFNRQETRYSLLQIQEILVELNMEFLGFEFADPSIIQEYNKAFPKDVPATNFENWHRIEEKKPLLFRGMYQFWCRPLAG